MRILKSWIGTLLLDLKLILYLNCYLIFSTLQQLLAVNYSYIIINKALKSSVKLM